MRGIDETSPNFAGFDAKLSGFIGNHHNDTPWKDAYTRVLPQNYDENETHPVDTFTREVLSKYATEGVTSDGKPNREFFILKDQALIIAKQVV